MFGRNKPKPPVLEQRYQVQSIFRTLQGEGPLSGKPSLFVRLTGCHLRCWFCDTAWDDDGDPWYELDELVDAIIAQAENVGVLVLTGGEPMRYPLEPLFAALRKCGFAGIIQIETAGTYWQNACRMAGVVTVVSPKTSNVAHAFSHPAHAAHVVWKYVLNADAIAEADGLPSAQVQRHKSLYDKRVGGIVARPPLGAIVYVQPCDEYDPDKNAANLLAVREVALKHGYTASIQLHKLLGVE